MSTPRGIRNNNPGNIVRTEPRTPWQGVVQLSEALSRDGRFEVFQSPVWGIRAIARTLITYQDKHGADTVRKIITRWAPPKGRDEQGRYYSQDTEAYIRKVSSALVVTPDQRIDVTDFDIALPLIQAIVLHENGPPGRRGYAGDWYDYEVYEEGLKRAGIVPRLKPALAEPKVAGTTVAASGAGALAFLPHLSGAKDLVEPGSVGATALGIIVAVAAAIALWSVLKKRRAERQ